MGRSVSSDPWIDAVKFLGRSVVVEHAEGVHIIMNVITKTRPKILRHPSEFSGFDGSIHMDEHSNRYMNITFYNARGTILGNIYGNESKTENHGQGRVHVPLGDSKLRNVTTRISMSSSINSTQFVCFHPKGDLDGEICQWCGFHAERLRKTSTNGEEFNRGKDSCIGCNKESADRHSWQTMIGALSPFLSLLSEDLVAALFIACAIVLIAVLCLVACCVSRSIRCVHRISTCICSCAHCVLSR